MGLNKSDIIIAIIAAILVAFIVADFWLIIHGYEQFSSALCGLLSGSAMAELIGFALYRSAKKHSEAKYLGGKSMAAQELQKEEANESRDQGKADQS